MVRNFHEDIIVSNIKPRHMSRETYLNLFRRSEKHGLPAYMRVLRKAYGDGKDGMFIWEVEGEAVGWSWLKIHENEFFEEGAYGEVNEIYVARKWRGKKIGTMMMRHAFNWFKERGVNTVRVEALACNRAAVSFYRRFGFKPNYIIFQKELMKKSARSTMVQVQ